VINTRDVITFQGQSVAELKVAFRESVDDYLAFCKERGEAPEKPFSGQFVTRISPELHRQVHLAAVVAGKSLNAWVTERLGEAVGRVESSRAAGKSGEARAKGVKRGAGGKKAVGRKA
jgi:predicted HicB family RNase H-like nuclease